MGIIDGLLERRSSMLANPDNWVYKLLGWTTDTHTGVSVDESTALKYMTVYTCVRILAQVVGQLPLIVYQRTDARNKERASGFPLYEKLHLRPNPNMSSSSWRKALTGHHALWGNAYCEIERDRVGRVLGLWPLPPNKTWAKYFAKGKNEGKLYYSVEVGEGKPRTISANDVLHVAGFSFGGIKGYSPISMAREGIALGLALEEFGARYFGSGTHPGIVLSHPGQFDDDGRRSLEESLSTNYAGLGKAHRVLLLEEGMKVEQIGFPPDDSQFLESRAFQRREICGFFGIPPHMVGDAEKEPHATAEQLGLEFVTYTLAPILVAFEQEINWKLFSPAERAAGYFAEFLVDGLLRGDMKSRYEAYRVGRHSGFLSANDVRAKENMNAIEGGDEYWQPVNMMTAAEKAELTAQNQPVSARSITAPEMRGGGSLARRRIRQRYRPLIRERFAELIQRESSDVLRKARKMLGDRDAVDDFVKWLEDYYERHPERFRAKAGAVIESLTAAIAEAAAAEIGNEMDAEVLARWVDEYIARRAERWSEKSLAILIKALRDEIADPEGNLIAGLERQLDDWKENRADSGANREHVQAAEAAAVTAWAAHGIRKLVWRAHGKNCPYCNALNGRVVAISEPFVGIGEDFQPEGAETPLRPTTSIGHAPAHNGCDCSVEPVIGV